MTCIKARLAYRPLSSGALFPPKNSDLAHSAYLRMLHLRISSSSGKDIEELQAQAPALAILRRVPQDAVAEPSNGTLNLIGAFSIMADGNKDIIIPGMNTLLLDLSHSPDCSTLQALLRRCGSRRPRVAPPPRHERPPLPLATAPFLDGVPHFLRRCLWLLLVARASWSHLLPQRQGPHSLRHLIPHIRC
jgi:hypothetical protein